MQLIGWWVGPWPCIRIHSVKTFKLKLLITDISYKQFQRHETTALRSLKALNALGGMQVFCFNFTGYTHIHTQYTHWQEYFWSPANWTTVNLRALLSFQVKYITAWIYMYHAHKALAWFLAAVYYIQGATLSAYTCITTIAISGSDADTVGYLNALLSRSIVDARIVQKDQR